MQNADFSIFATMVDYIDRKVKEIPLSRDRCKQHNDQVTEQERAQLRSMTMVLMWAARECRFDILGAVSILSRRIVGASVQDLLDCNRVVKHLKATRELGIKFHAIYPTSIVLGVTVDGGLAEKGEIFCQAGYLAFLTVKNMALGIEAPLSLIVGRSGKVDRVCSSSLAVEAYAMVGGTASVEWVTAAFHEFANAKATSSWSKRRIDAWDASEPGQPPRLDAGCDAGAGQHGQDAHRRLGDL